MMEEKKILSGRQKKMRFRMQIAAKMNKTLVGIKKKRKV